MSFHPCTGAGISFHNFLGKGEVQVFFHQGDWVSVCVCTMFLKSSQLGFDKHVWGCPVDLAICSACIWVSLMWGPFGNMAVGTRADEPGCTWGGEESIVFARVSCISKYLEVHVESTSLVSTDCSIPGADRAAVASGGAIKVHAVGSPWPPAVGGTIIPLFLEEESFDLFDILDLVDLLGGQAPFHDLFEVVTKVEVIIWVEVVNLVGADLSFSLDDVWVMFSTGVGWGDNDLVAVIKGVDECYLHRSLGCGLLGDLSCGWCSC